MTDEQAQALRRADLDPDPVRQFARWFGEAATTVRVPEAMALATADADGVPSVRMVLMKGFDERGLVFHTHYSSRKGRELAANPRAALLFHWSPPGRQVRVEGVGRLLRNASARCADRRPRLAPERGALRPRRARAARRGGGTGARRLGTAASRVLGRVSTRAGGVGVLAAPRQPPPRPVSLHAPRRRVAHRAAISLARASSDAP